MPQGNPKPGERYLHFKNKMYQVIAIGKHSETDEKMVVYQALYGEYGVCIRPYDMFISEVDHEKYPQVTQKYRFLCLGYGDEKPTENTAGQALEKTERPEKLEHRESTLKKIEEALSEQTEALFEEESQREAAVLPEAEKSQMKADGLPESEESQANPWLMKFLDAESFEEKYKIVSEMYADMDDKLIDDLAVCLDVVIPEGKLQDRYLQLKQCIRTRQKFEGYEGRRL